MAITYTWTIESMSVLQTPDPDFVVTANWLCSGTDGTNVAEIGGSSTFTQQGQINSIVTPPVSPTAEPLPW